MSFAVPATSTAQTTDQKQLPTFEDTGVPYRQQGALQHVLGRALDVLIVAGATHATMLGLRALGGTSLPSTDSWLGCVILILVLLGVTFFYGCLAGTVGTLGDLVTGMRVVRRSDGTKPGFRTGGTRALGWFVLIVFDLMLSNTGGVLESRFVAVRRESLTTSPTA